MNENSFSVKENFPKTVSLQRRFFGWFIHAFTTSGVCFGLFALLAIHHQKPLLALWFMTAAVVVDAVDGFFARRIQIKEAVPTIDGALLDNIVDFFNYTIVPCFFLLVTPLLPENWRVLCVIAIVFSSAFQFTQVDAKTNDHFFKGFPSYWNIAVFYLFFWQLNAHVNMVILLALAILSFVPIKYIYPSRMDYLTSNSNLRFAMIIMTVLWGLATTGILWLYPESNYFLVAISVGYMLLYIVFSIYRTFVPLSNLTLVQE